MLQVTILSFGKIKDNWLKESLSEYQKRLKGKITIDFKLVKDLKTLENLVKSLKYVALDSQGIMISSQDFSKKLFDHFAKYHSEIFFVIGGADGLSSSILTHAYAIFSFSKLTFPHQLVYLILVEQIYRAHEIFYNHPYPR